MMRSNDGKWQSNYHDTANFALTVCERARVLNQGDKDNDSLIADIIKKLEDKIEKLTESNAQLKREIETRFIGVDSKLTLIGNSNDKNLANVKSNFKGKLESLDKEMALRNNLLESVLNLKTSQLDEKISALIKKIEL